MAKYNIPKREFSAGVKKMISMGLPQDLMRELESLAKEKGWTTTDLVTTALDQFVQWEKKEKGKS